MQQQQTSEMQKRLQIRKQNRRYKIRTEGQTSSINSIQLFNPSIKKKGNASPGKMYVRSLKPKTCFSTLQDEIALMYNSQKEEQRQNSQSLKLPLLKNKNKLVKYYIPKEKKQKYRFSTRNSQEYIKQNQSTVRKSKRICSVDCKSRQNTSSKQKVSRNKSSKKIIKIMPQNDKDYQYERSRSPALEDYLQTQSSPNGPSSTLKQYISRIRINQLEDSHYHNQLYSTYFGLQPNFHILETEYAKQIYSIQPIDESQLQKHRHYQIPQIPSERRLSEFIKRYRSFGKQINMTNLINADDFFIQYSPQQLFFGLMFQQSREGLGVLIGQNYLFQGIFKNNYKVKGIQISPLGIYRGDFYHNKKEGRGSIEWINGQTYIGDWKNGYRHGNGVWTNRKGQSYNGQWQRGKGKGTGTYLSQRKQYKGDFYDCRKDGWGREKHYNGDIYEGGFKIGLPEGRGTYIWSNGTTYEGQFSRGMRSGKGILSTLDGFTYNGQFTKEKPQGLCSLKTPNGDVYEGFIRGGKKNGGGVLKLFKSKITLDGYWKEDRYLTKSLF